MAEETYIILGLNDAIAKTDLEGNIIWNKALTDPDDSGDLIYLEIADNGSIFACGTHSSLDFRGIVKIDPNGDEEWRYSNNTTYSLAVDNEQEYIYFGKGTESSLLKKMDFQGNLIDSVNTGLLYREAVFKNGLLYMGAEDNKIVIYDRDLTKIGEQEGPSTSSVNSLQVDEEGNTYACSFNGTLRKVSWELVGSDLIPTVEWTFDNFIDSEEPTSLVFNEAHKALYVAGGSFNDPGFFYVIDTEGNYIRGLDFGVNEIGDFFIRIDTDNNVYFLQEDVDNDPYVNVYDPYLNLLRQFPTPFVLNNPSIDLEPVEKDPFYPNIFIGQTDNSIDEAENDEDSLGSITSFSSSNSDSTFTFITDDLGNKYVGTGNGLVKKYGPGGSLLWTYDFQSQDAVAVSLAIDNEYNVYATGGEDQTLRKIDSQGNHLWTNALPANSVSVDVGPDNRAVSSTNDGVIRKFYENGDELWSNSSSASGPVTNIRIDQDNNIYCTELQNPGLNAIKLDSSGNELWVHNNPAVFLASDSTLALGRYFVNGFIFGLDEEDQPIEIYMTIVLNENGDPAEFDYQGGDAPFHDNSDIVSSSGGIEVDSNGFIYLAATRTETSNKGVEVLDLNFNRKWSFDSSSSNDLIALAEPPPSVTIEQIAVTSPHQELDAGITNIVPQFPVDIAVQNPQQTLSSSITYSIDRDLDFSVENPFQTITASIDNDSPEYALTDVHLINPQQTLSAAVETIPNSFFDITATNPFQTLTVSITLINPRNVDIAVTSPFQTIDVAITRERPLFEIETSLQNPEHTLQGQLSWGAERHFDFQILNNQQVLEANIAVPETISFDLENYHQVLSATATSIVPQFNLETDITNYQQVLESDWQFLPTNPDIDIGPLTNPMQELDLGLFYGIYPRTIEEIDLDNPQQVLEAEITEFHHSNITSEIILPQVELDFQIAWFDANIPLTRYVQQPSLDERIELFEIDATVIGGLIYRFTASSNHPIFFQGKEFTPLPVETEGFEWNGQGALPTPKMRFSSVSTVIRGLVIEHNGFLGCQVKRIRTFRRFLDGQVSEDPDAHFPIDIYNVNRKTNQNKVFVEFELAAAMDQEGRKLPGRVVIRDVCTHKYRFYDPDTGDFDYSQATCPYTGNDFFDRADMPTTKDKDVCSRRLSGCRARFGNGNLPTRQFPGAAKVRV